MGAFGGGTNAFCVAGSSATKISLCLPAAWTPSVQRCKRLVFLNSLMATANAPKHTLLMPR